MKIHHLNCGTLCPRGGGLFGGKGGPWAVAPMCCHCLLIEGEDGFILVDSGLGVMLTIGAAGLSRAARRLVRTSGTIERNSLMGLDIEIEFCLRGDLEAEEIEGAGLGGRWPCEDGCGACVAEADAVAREVGEVL